jgi:hypothetical protein
MIGIKCRRLTLLKPGAAQPHRYAPFQLRAAPSLLALEILS